MNQNQTANNVHQPWPVLAVAGMVTGVSCHFTHSYTTASPVAVTIVCAGTEGFIRNLDTYLRDLDTLLYIQFHTLVQQIIISNKN